MTLDQLTELFKWMTICNVAVFLISAVLTIMFKGFVCRMHGMIFGIDKEELPMALYKYLGTHRIFILTFNLIPYVSLLILNRS